MKNSHRAVLTRKGLNYGVWFGFIVNEKQGKQKSLNCYRIITNVADHQNALQEHPHKTHKVGSLERQCNSAINCSALWNVDYEQPKQILVISLTFVVCLLLQMKTVEQTSWQEQNWGKCKSDTPCLMQRVWVQEQTQTKSQSNIELLQE